MDKKSKCLSPPLRAMSAGLSQTVWHTSPLCALILALTLLFLSPVQFLCCLAALLAAAPLAFLMKLPREDVLDGLYTVNPALAGLSLPLVLAGCRPQALPWLLPLSAVGGILALGFTILLRRWLCPRGLSPLGVPFSLALAILVPLVRFVLPAAPVVPAEPVIWNVSNFLLAAGNGIAQVPWLETTPIQPLAALLVLLAIASASKTDALVAAYAALLAAGMGVLLGLEGTVLLSGQLGFGSVLLSTFLFGQVYPRTKESFVLISLLSAASPVFTALLRVPFSILGIPTAAIPWSVLTWIAMAAKAPLTGQGRT